MKNLYLVDVIQALYTNYTDDIITGGVNLNLNKVVEAINYYTLKAKSLHKVKLMKMLWFGDSLSYKRNKKAITGLVYRALPMGAVVEDFEIKKLSTTDIEILDAVIDAVGHLNSQEIINRMHEEEAYKCTDINSIIPFTYAEKLSLS